jgi:sulfur-carrier protein
MRVEVALYAGLRQFRPAGAAGRTIGLELSEGATVADVMRRLGIPDDLPCISVLNGQRADRETAVPDGAELGFFPPLAGGRRAGRREA